MYAKSSLRLLAVKNRHLLPLAKDVTLQAQRSRASPGYDLSL
jgi:hypothetical protein